VPVRRGLGAAGSAAAKAGSSRRRRTIRRTARNVNECAGQVDSFPGDNGVTGTGARKTGTNAGKRVSDRRIRSATPTRKSTGEFIDDAAITTRVKTAFAQDPGVKALDVKIDTFKGNVQLNGFVNTAEEKARAQQIALGIDGGRERPKPPHREDPDASVTTQLFSVGHATLRGVAFLFHAGASSERTGAWSAFRSDGRRPCRVE